MPLKAFVLSLLACLGLCTGVAVAGDSGSTPPPIATESGFVCPTGKNGYDIDAWIHVTKWCIVPGVRDQVQVKVQMKIHNSSRSHRLDIGQDKIRLIVRHFNRSDWTPPRIGPATLDRPIETTYGGERVWAIPANAETAYDDIPHSPGIGTFATHWYGTSLAPGATFVPHYHYGDLVFYLPRQRHASPRSNIVGIAFVKNADILALCDPDVWGRHRPAASF